MGGSPYPETPPETGRGAGHPVEVPGLSVLFSRLRPGLPPPPSADAPPEGGGQEASRSATGVSATETRGPRVRPFSRSHSRSTLLAPVKCSTGLSVVSGGPKRLTGPSPGSTHTTDGRSPAYSRGAPPSSW